VRNVLFAGLFLFTIMACKNYDYSQVKPASEKQIWIINEGLEDGLKVVKSCALKSSAHKRAYFVAAKFSSSDASFNAVGVWLITGTKKEPGLIKSVNGIAEEFTPYLRDQSAFYDKECKIVESYLE